MTVINGNEPTNKPTSYQEVVEKTRQYEFKALVKVMNDMGIELRLLVALAEQLGQDTVSAEEVKKIVYKYEDEAIEVMRTSIRMMNEVK